MPEFIHGRELSGLFFHEVIQPMLRKQYPRLSYSAGLFGYGSEVLGYDTEMSRDHDWGPRLQLFLQADDVVAWKTELFDFFANQLPHQFHGYSTHFGKPNPDDHNTRHLEVIDEGPISHRIEIYSWEEFLTGYLPVDVMHTMSSIDWLLIPQQRLRTIVDGCIYHDSSGSLASMKTRLAWYPETVWMYLLASAWSRIGQEEHLMGRCGSVDDETGSALLGNSIVRVLIQICFLLEKRYAPYPKWFGTAFHEMPCAAELDPFLRAVQTANHWKKREAALCEAYRLVVRQMNEIQLIAPVSNECTDFFGRPFSVIWGGQIAELFRQKITDPVLRAAPLIGSVDLMSSSTDVLENNSVCRGFRHVFMTDDGS